MYSYQSINQAINLRTINQSNNQSINPSIHQPINESINQSILYISVCTFRAFYYYYFIIIIFFKPPLTDLPWQSEHETNESKHESGSGFHKEPYFK